MHLPSPSSTSGRQRDGMQHRRSRMRTLRPFMPYPPICQKKMSVRDLRAGRQSPILNILDSIMQHRDSRPFVCTPLQAVGAAVIRLPDRPLQQLRSQEKLRVSCSSSSVCLFPVSSINNRLGTSICVLHPKCRSHLGIVPQYPTSESHLGTVPESNDDNAEAKAIQAEQTTRSANNLRDRFKRFQVILADDIGVGPCARVVRSGMTPSAKPRRSAGASTMKSRKATLFLDRHVPPL